MPCDQDRVQNFTGNGGGGGGGVGGFGVVGRGGGPQPSADRRIRRRILAIPGIQFVETRDGVGNQEDTLGAVLCQGQNALRQANHLVEQGAGDVAGRVFRERRLAKIRQSALRRA